MLSINKGKQAPSMQWEVKYMCEYMFAFLLVRHTARLCEIVIITANTPNGNRLSENAELRVVQSTFLHTALFAPLTCKTSKNETLTNILDENKKGN